MPNFVNTAWTRRLGVVIVFETILIAVAIAIGAGLGHSGEAGWAVFSAGHGVLKALLIVAVCQICLYFVDLYDLHEVSDRRELFIRIIQALGATSLVLSVIYFWLPAVIIERGVFVAASLLTISFVAGWRLTFDWYARRARPRERLLLVGTGASAVNLARELFERRVELGIDIVGFVDPDPARVGMPLLNPGIIGTIEDIPSIVRARSVDRVVVSLADARGTLPMDKLLELKMQGVTFDHLASIYEQYTGKIAVDNLRPSWLIFSSGFKKSARLRAAKRLVDVSVAGLALLLLSPVLALVALAVKVTSPGDIFYHQQRVGKGGRVFTIHKFRSMRSDAEAATGAVWASKAGDPRVTRIGGILRRTRLDELPQLWNVLIGDMSLAGPRPERPQFVEELTRQIPFYGERHLVRPGLTGWAQVRYAYGASVQDALEKLQYDLFYIKNVSLAFDLFIALSTVKIVVLRRGSA